MATLQHPAVEATERLQDGQDVNLQKLDRGEVKYVIAALLDFPEGFDESELKDEIMNEDGSARVTSAELRAIALGVAGTGE